MDRWKGKIALVTGASSGIGAQIAEKLAQNGIKVVGVARRVHLMVKLREKLKEHFPDAEELLVPVKADLSVNEEIYETFEWIKSNVGNVSVLINNAGIALNDTFINGSPENWRKILDVNLSGVAVLSKLVIENMLACNIDDGHVINVNSISGHHVYDVAKLNMYVPSKFALRAFGEVLRVELKRFASRIKISSISPGRVDTEILDDFIKDPALFKNVPKLGSVDVANSVLFMLSTPEHVLISELIIHHVEDYVK